MAQQFPESPVVRATEQCNHWNSAGERCKNPTGNIAAGVDADLCPEHREIMQAQRDENRKAWEAANEQ